MAFKIDLTGLVEARAACDPEVLRKALRSACKKIGAQARTATIRTLTSLYMLQASDIREKIDVKVSTESGLTAVINSKAAHPLALSLFAKSYQRKSGGGASIKIKKDSARDKIPHAFIGTMQSGHTGLFSRYKFKGEIFKKRKMERGRYVGKVRTPIRELSGPWLPSLMGGRKVVDAVTALVNEKADAIIGHEIEYYQGKV